MDGTPLRSGLKYFILPAVSGNGGGVALDRTKTKKCPLSVFQDDYELSKGLSVVFLPVNAKPGYTVQTATDLNIEFTAETACDEATVWKVESYDHDVKQWFIGTGGIEGKPGPRTVDNWSGTTYYVLPATSGEGGGVALASTTSDPESCPLTVVQDDDEISQGLPLTFSPVNTKLGYTVRTFTDLNIKVSANTACDEGTVWKVDDYDDDVEQWFVGTGGVEGNPGPRTVKNWFKIW
ncbi:Kunitz trypsin inhibitor 5, partial [Linum perenne]